MKVLRLGHRAGRDDRISTHVGLTARQWGAEEVIYSGERDKNMLKSVEDIVERWGGNFNVRYEESYMPIIKNFEGLTVHLTMYGEKIGQKMSEIKESVEEENLLVVVGSEKVPRKVYTNVDYNISVGNQPHSEIAALAVFLDRFNEGSLKEDFQDADIRVVPSENKKLTEEF